MQNSKFPPHHHYHQKVWGDTASLWLMIAAKMSLASQQMSNVHKQFITLCIFFFPFLSLSLFVPFSLPFLYHFHLLHPFLSLFCITLTFPFAGDQFWYKPAQCKKNQRSAKCKKNQCSAKKKPAQCKVQRKTSPGRPLCL